MKNKYLNEMFTFIGAAIAVVIGLALIGLLIYGLLGYIDDAPGNRQRIVATVLIFIIPLAFYAGLREGKAHRAGIERGIDLKVGAQRAVSAKPSPVPSSNGQTPSWQSIVPPPVEIKVQSHQSDDVVIL